MARNVQRSGMIYVREDKLPHVPASSVVMCCGLVRGNRPAAGIQ